MKLFDEAYVTALEDTLRKMMYSGNDIAEGTLDQDGWVQMFRGAQVLLGDLTEQELHLQPENQVKEDDDSA